MARPAPRRRSPTPFPTARGTWPSNTLEGQALRARPRPGTVRVIEKPWGREILYALHPRYAAKVIVVEKGRRLSLQYHAVKHETIFVLEGRLFLRLGKGTRVLEAGMAAVIPPRTVHRFEARSGRVTLLEASTPELDDVVRLEDDFGRIPRPPAGVRKTATARHIA